MSFQNAYNKSASREIEFEPKENSVEVEIQKEEIKKWLALPITRELLLFLGRRELELLNNSRNAVKISLLHENIAKNLLKAIAYREVIEYLTINKKPVDIE